MRNKLRRFGAADSQREVRVGTGGANRKSATAASSATASGSPTVATAVNLTRLLKLGLIHDAAIWAIATASQGPGRRARRQRPPPWPTAEEPQAAPSDYRPPASPSERRTHPETPVLSGLLEPIGWRAYPQALARLLGWPDEFSAPTGEFEDLLVLADIWIEVGAAILGGVDGRADDDGAAVVGVEQLVPNALGLGQP
jgi:hypothetical protein